MDYPNRITIMPEKVTYLEARTLGMASIIRNPLGILWLLPTVISEPGLIYTKNTYWLVSKLILLWWLKAAGQSSPQDVPVHWVFPVVAVSNRVKLTGICIVFLVLLNFTPLLGLNINRTVEGSDQNQFPHLGCQYSTNNKNKRKENQAWQRGAGEERDRKTGLRKKWEKDRGRPYIRKKRWVNKKGETEDPEWDGYWGKGEKEKKEKKVNILYSLFARAYWLLSDRICGL